MSSEVLEPPPTEIISAKSEDKLEIEKEEQENKEEKKEEDTKEEKKDEETKKDGDTDKKDDTESKPAEDATTSDKSAADGDKSEEKGADEPTESAEKDGADGEKKKGFSLPKVNIKTPKVIKDIRAKSKERKKKKDQEGEKSDEPEKGAEGTTDEAAKTEEGEEKKEGEEAATAEGEATAEATEAVTSPSAKDKVKEAFDNIKLPKMHRPAFLKKNKEKTENTEDGEDKKDDAKDGEETAKDGETADNTDDGDNKEESEKADNETEKKEDSAEGEKCTKDGDEKSADAEKSDLKSAASMDKLKDTVEETKNSLACTLKGLKTRFKGLKGGKAKEGEGGAEEGGEEGKEGEAADEKEKLLDNPENKDDVDADETEGAVKEVKEKKHVRALRTIRHAASGVPLMFKDIEMTQEEDIELGEDLLDKGGENKEGDQSKEALQEINLEDTKDEKESEEKKDTKSVTSEKKDPEKGEKEEGGDGDKGKDPELGGEAPAPKRRFKKNKCHVFHQRFKNLDDQQKMGVIGMLVGVFIFFIIILAIISAAAHPSGWSDHHRYVEGGNYISTNTGCGELWGHVDGDHMFSFRGIPYSIQVGRFEKSEGLTKLDDCGDEIKKTANETVFCARRNAKEEIIGFEDCLLLDIYTPTVMYDAQKPVIVYIPGDDLENLPTSQLANEMGVVYVVVHVRQGVLGFLSHSALSDAYPKTSGNYALGDLITALQWINTNIAHFGGNKEAVTVLGHRQGASLATVLTGVRSADGLYHRVWATGGAGRFSNHSTDDSTDLWTQLVQDTCPGIQGGSAVKDCLLDTDVDTLLRAVDSNWEVWSPAFGQVPKAGAEEPQGLLTVDTVLLDKSLQATWEADGVAVPLVLGSDQQGEAQADSHQYLEWENNDVYREHIEGNLGSWNIELPGMVLERYNTSDNWVDYMSIVSDIRTVCPMANLATSLSVPMYVVTSPRDNGELGQLADKSADLAAFFAITGEDDIKPFQTKLRGMFYEYARTGASFDGIRLVSDQDLETVVSLENCDFWQEAEAEIITTYGKIF